MWNWWRRFTVAHNEQFWFYDTFVKFVIKVDQDFKVELISKWVAA
jgi:hypothetical protein